MAVVAGGDRLKTGCFIGHSRMDTKLLRLILLKRDSSDRIDRAAHELTEFLHSHPDTELLTVAVIEDLDPATLDGSEVAVVLGGDGAIIADWGF